MTGIVSYGGRKPLSASDPAFLSMEEQANAFKTFVAYGGRYTLSGDKIIHHVEISSIQNWVNADLIRSVRFEGERLTLAAPPAPVNGKMQTFELIWQRLPASSR